MIDTEYLSRLVTLLKEKGVQSFKTASLELSFQPELKSAALDEKRSLEAPPAFTIEGQLPVDLRTDGAHGQDKVLFWSGSPDPNETTTPGVEDLPLQLATPEASGGQTGT